METSEPLGPEQELSEPRLADFDLEPSWRGGTVDLREVDAVVIVPSWQEEKREATVTPGDLLRMMILAMRSSYGQPLHGLKRADSDRDVPVGFEEGGIEIPVALGDRVPVGLLRDRAWELGQACRKSKWTQFCIPKAHLIHVGGLKCSYVFTNHRIQYSMRCELRTEVSGGYTLSFRVIGAEVAPGSDGKGTAPLSS